MDFIRENLKKPYAIPAASFLVGILIGWLLLGWGLFPVQWTDATPQYLRADLKTDYLRMAIDSYGANGDGNLAKNRWAQLGKEAPELMNTVQANPQGLKLQALTGFAKAVDVSVMISPGAAEVAPENETTAVDGSTTVETVISPELAPLPVEKPKNTMLPFALALFCVLSLVLGFALVYIFLKKGGKLPGRPGKAEAMPSEMPIADVPADKGAEYFRPAAEAPVSQFMTTYMQGDEQYDDSFSIDNAIGEFLGECGVGITETIGVGEPKKSTAFEVWLFDKNDIQTVTKVLMSDHAFRDPALQQKLMSKGEPILAEPGKRILLETATLQLEARIVDMNYGQGPLPANSYFERLTLELAVWPKNK